MTDVYHRIAIKRAKLAMHVERNRMFPSNRKIEIMTRNPKKTVLKNKKTNPTSPTTFPAMNIRVTALRE
jgi:hypothetical protein